MHWFCFSKEYISLSDWNFIRSETELQLDLIPIVDPVRSQLDKLKFLDPELEVFQNLDKVYL